MKAEFSNGNVKIIAPASITSSSDDKVIIVLGEESNHTIAAASIFAEGQKIQDAYSGQQTIVCNGAVTLELGEVALLEIT